MTVPTVHRQQVESMRNFTPRPCKACQFPSNSRQCPRSGFIEFVNKNFLVYWPVENKSLSLSRCRVTPLPGCASCDCATIGTERVRRSLGSCARTSTSGPRRLPTRTSRTPTRNSLHWVSIYTFMYQLCNSFLNTNFDWLR